MKVFKNILVYLFFVFILTLISSCISELSMDGIWNFGFSYNIVNGSIPYKDFNMVIGPFYNLIIVLFLKLFGNYVIVFQLANSMIISVFMVFIYNKIRNNTIYLLLLLTSLCIIYSYNVFCSFLIIGILLLEDSNFNYKDIIIGLFIGIILMTKHNIGIVILLVSLMINKNKLKLILGTSIVPIIICLYLIYNDAFFSYIDFCYLGLGNFLDNFYFQLPIFIVMLIIIIILIRRYILTKDNKILYLLGFQIINFPLIDYHHFMVSMIPIIYYIFLVINEKKYIKFIKIIIIVCSICMTIINLSNFNMSKIPFLKYNNVPSNTDKYINGMKNYIEEKQKKHRVYIFSLNAYLIKISLNQKITFTDLINKGNLGSNEVKYINYIYQDCQKEKCLFILDLSYFNGIAEKKGNQINPIFKEYVLENAYYLETLPSGDRVYVNYKITPED